MATIKSFAALRPRPELAAQICELPYDVMSSEEARQIAAGNPLSFLHVSKPEIDLPPATNPYGLEVYQKSRKNFQNVVEQGVLRQDPKPCLYLYRQRMGSHTQVGLVAVVSCEEYLQGKVKKHELTRPDKEDDRVRHIEALNSQTGPVFLVYPAQKAIDDLVAAKIELPPAIDFTAADGINHTAWVITEEQHIRHVEQEFARLDSLYIADGHHRCAAAARVYKTRQGEGESGFFLSVIFPHNQVQILPYNRVLKDLNGHSSAELLQMLEQVFVRQPVDGKAPTQKHQLSLYLGGKWHGLHFRPQFGATLNVMDNLDVTLLQKHVLQPIFGIDDPRTSKRIDFVGGIRGTGELEKLVNSGECACAFALFPTRIEELMAIADTGGIMPPKSTWFEPKLRDAMFCHSI